MTLFEGILLAIVGSFATHVHAENCLNNLPQSIRSIVEQDNWTILQPENLSGTDLKIWKGNHPGECPGVASGDFYPKGKPAFLIALIQHDQTQGNEPAKQLEKLTLVYIKKDQPVSEVVVPPTQVAAPLVVSKLRPGHYMGLDGTKASISRDSFIYERPAGFATQFYYDGTHLKSFVISR
jgi:hypothetical protein